MNYPSPIDIDTFVTDSTGTLMLPEPLPFGNYELYEQQSPWGYVFDGEPVPFVVDGTQDVITVEKYNIAQKGTITVSKEGEVFSHVAEAGGCTSLNTRCRASRALSMTSPHWKISSPRMVPST